MTDTRNAVFKWLLYGITLWLTMALQLFLPLRIGQIRALPVIPLAILVAVFEGAKGGGVFGLLAGLLCDAFIPPSEAFFSIALLLLGVLVGFSTERLFRKNLLTGLLWSVAGQIAVDVFFFAFFYWIGGRAGFDALLAVAPAEVLITLPAVPILYVFIRSIYRKFHALQPLF